MKPKGARWDHMGWAPPSTIPHTIPDRKETPETLLVGPKGEPLIVRKPRPFGFRPEDAR
jgi:hypothetical protein